MKKALSTCAGKIRSSLLAQLIALVLSTALLLVMVALFFNRYAYSSLLISEVKSVEEDYLHMQRQNVNVEIRKMNNYLIEVVINDKLLTAVKAYIGGASQDKAESVKQIREIFSEFASNTAIVHSTYVSPEGEIVLHSRLQTNWTDSAWFGGVNKKGYNEELLALCERTNVERGLQVSAQPSHYAMTGTPVIHFAYPMIDLHTKKEYGTIVLSFRTNTLLDMVNPVPYDPEKEKLSFGVLTLEDGTVIAHEDKGLIGAPFEEPETMLVFSLPVAYYQMRLYRVIDQQALAAHSYRNTRTMTLLMTAIAAAYAFLTIALFRRMMRSIRELRGGLRTVQKGQFAVSVPTRSANEIGQITEAFNVMAEQLQEMDAQRLHETENKMRALNDLRIAEIRALENQINSHFLYNTLNTINYTAIQHDDYDVSTQIKHLSLMLRYTFDRSDKIVRAKREAEWLEEYLSLQKLRYGPVFDYRIAMDAEVEDWPMKKLIIQPFVENSIMHGFAGRSYGGVLTVEFAAYDKTRMRVSIRDNGRGIERKSLECLRRKTAGPLEETDSQGIGLENAFLRIRSYYNDDARIYLRSWKGLGTSVVLLLPRIEE